MLYRLIDFHLIPKAVDKIEYQYQSVLYLNIFLYIKQTMCNIFISQNRKKTSALDEVMRNPISHESSTATFSLERERVLYDKNVAHGFYK